MVILGGRKLVARYECLELSALLPFPCICPRFFGCLLPKWVLSMTSAPQNHQHKLAENVLGLFESVVMAVAGSAPAYSIAASTALLVAAVGLAGPASLLYCGIAMYGICLLYTSPSPRDS